MTDSTQTRLGVENPHRSAAKVRQLGPESLGLPLEDAGQEETDSLPSLRERAEEAASGSDVGVAVRTEDGTVSTGVGLSGSVSRDVHALELAVWKAYEESGSPVVDVSMVGEKLGDEPCGRCLQVLADFSGEVAPTIHVWKGSDAEEFSLDEVLLR